MSEVRSIRAVSSAGMRAYAAFTRWAHRVVVPRWVNAERLEGAKNVLKSLERLPADDRQRRVWFHAASVGELESLWPLIVHASQESSVFLIITVFSSSALRHLHRNSMRLPPEKVLYAGYSPFEGSWGEALDASYASLFVTAKYEAWPELWHSVGMRKIPLAIVGAKHRSSLKAARLILKVFRGRLPQLELVTFDAANEAPLRRAFPSAQLHVDSDPRWDRVFQRLEQVPERVREIQRRFGDLPRPWIIFGQVWPTDMEELQKRGVLDAQGTFFFVPHKTDAASVKDVEIRFREIGLTPVRTSDGTEIRPAGRVAILVDEMGFLAELYRLGDFAYVGGGFGAGVHSTIEPAVAGLSSAAGPNGAEKFDEITWLSQKELLIVLTSDLDWNRWKERLQSGQVARKEQISELVAGHRGASERIWKVLRRALG